MNTGIESRDEDSSDGDPGNECSVILELAFKEGSDSKHNNGQTDKDVPVVHVNSLL